MDERAGQSVRVARVEAGDLVRGRVEARPVRQAAAGWMGGATTWAVARVRTSFAHQPWCVDLWSGATAAGFGAYGLVLRLTIEQNPSYTVLTQYLDGNAWLRLMVVLGLVQIAAAAFNLKAIRWVMALVMCSLWGLLGYSIMRSPSVSPGAIVFLGWACGNAHTVALVAAPRLASFLRVRRDE